MSLDTIGGGIIGHVGTSTTSSAPLETRFNPPFEAVQITAADYNGRTWDGSPFSSFPDWLKEVLDAGRIEPVTPNSTDYAEWQLTTDKGTVLGTPGDWIVRDRFGRIRILTDREAVPLDRAEQLAAMRVKARHLDWDIRHLARSIWHEQRGEPEPGMEWCGQCDGHGHVGERESCFSCCGEGQVQAS